MSKHRLFIGFRLPATIRGQLAALQDGLRDELNNKAHSDLRHGEPSAIIDWSSRENLHLTVRYLGPTDSSVVSKLVRDLNQVSNNHRPLSLSLADIGYFPNSNHPRVLWIGLNSDTNTSHSTGLDQLHDLRTDVDAIAAGHNYPADQQGFAPHITLAYIRPGEITRPAGLPPKLKPQQTLSNTNVFTLDTLSLIQTKPTDGDSVYADIAEFTLG